MFRTELPLTPLPQQLPQSARVLTIGSCFSDSIGKRLQEFKVATMVNPFGTVFNPVSLCRLLRAAAGEDMDWQQHLVEARGRWQSHDLHAELGAESPVELLQRIQTMTREVGVFLATADAVVLTLGSAFAYRLRETDEIVSNCHKLPADKFEKELLTADDIIAAVAETHAYLRRINPRLQFILTVSPVRHVKDTLVLNSTSKSMLRVACHYLSELLPDVTYFPAYELLLDDLRDYRFYAADMLHPSDVAEHYIWERFTRTYFDAAFGRFKKEWESVKQALGHRPLYAAAPEYRQFLESTLERLRKLSGQADVRLEQLHLERELQALPLPPAPPEPEEEDDDEEERIDIGDEAEDTPAQATLVGNRAGMLVEAVGPDDEEEEAEAEPFVNPESAYEHAYTAGLVEEDHEEEETEAEVNGLETGEEPVRRKKRRSRGGAKRTKRKHARLAAEANAALETAGSISNVEPAPETVSEPAAAEPVVEAPATETADTQEPGADAPATPARSRNNRRNRRERPARTNSRAPLYATEPISADDDTEVVAPAEPAAPVAVAAEPPAPVAPAPLIADVTPPVEPAAPATPAKRPARSRRKAPAPLALPEVTLPTPEATEVLPPAALADEAATSSEIPAPVKPKSRSRRKPAKTAAVVEAVAEPVAAVPDTASPEAAVPEVAPKPAARKRAPRKPKAEAPTPAATPAAPVAEAAPAAPKRAPRPSRRKAAPDASANETT